MYPISYHDSDRCETRISKLGFLLKLLKLQLNVSDFARIYTAMGACSTLLNANQIQLVRYLSSPAQLSIPPRDPSL